jgi:hypothetical protein
MSIVEYTVPRIEWQTPTELLSTTAIVMVEQFVSVGTPAERTLAGSIVDEYAEDLRRLADA